MLNVARLLNYMKNAQASFKDGENTTIEENRIKFGALARELDWYIKHIEDGYFDDPVQ